MGRGSSDSGSRQAQSRSEAIPEHILYGTTEPREEHSGTSHYVTIDGITYKSALPRYAPTNNDVDSSVRRLILQWPGIASNRSQALHYMLCVLGTARSWVNGQYVSDYDLEEDYYERHSKDKPLLEDPEEQYLFLKMTAEKERELFEQREAQRDPAEVAKEKEAISKAVDKLVEASKLKAADKKDTPQAGQADSKETESVEEFRERLLREDAVKIAERNRATREDLEELAQTTECVQNLYPLSEGCGLLSFPDDIEADWLDAVEETATMVLEAPIEAYDSYPNEEAQQIRFKNNRKYAAKALERVAAVRNR